MGKEIADFELAACNIAYRKCGVTINGGAGLVSTYLSTQIDAVVYGNT